MFFAHLVERSGITLQVSWATRAVFAIAAWGSWAMGAVAVVCAEAEIHTFLWWPVDPWALGLAALTIGLPLSSMYRCVQVQTDPLTWPV
jgi:hypothetical protein